MAIATATSTTASRLRAGGVPPIVTVFKGDDGNVHHARCGTAITFRGLRGGQEIDFYCRSCHEHITLPGYVLNNLPRKEDTIVASTVR